MFCKCSLLIIDGITGGDFVDIAPAKYWIYQVLKVSFFSNLWFNRNNGVLSPPRKENWDDPLLVVGYFGYSTVVLIMICWWWLYGVRVKQLVPVIQWVHFFTMGLVFRRWVDDQMVGAARGVGHHDLLGAFWKRTTAVLSAEYIRKRFFQKWCLPNG